MDDMTSATTGIDQTDIDPGVVGENDVEVLLSWFFHTTDPGEIGHLGLQNAA